MAQTENLVFKAADETAMVDFGAALYGALKGRGVVYLVGDLGMGKTTFSRGVIQRAGHTGAVKSPTYTLVEPYELTTGQIYHFDLYRLADPEELEYLGVRDYFEGSSLSLVEWPCRGRGWLPEADLQIDIHLDGRGRRLVCQANNSHGVQALTQLHNRLSQQA